MFFEGIATNATSTTNCFCAMIAGDKTRDGGIVDILILYILSSLTCAPLPLHLPFILRLMKAPPYGTKKVGVWSRSGIILDMQ